jgi:hypothetical protein
MSEPASPSDFVWYNSEGDDKPMGSGPSDKAKESSAPDAQPRPSALDAQPGPSGLRSTALYMLMEILICFYQQGLLVFGVTDKVGGWPKPSSSRRLRSAVSFSSES